MRRLIWAVMIGWPATAQSQPDSSSFDGWSLDRPEVVRYLDFFQGPGRARMQAWLARGASYRGLIRDRLSSLGLPDEFEFLPMIESGYSSAARSHAGAVGLWQFMPETAREYGLTVDPRTDERRHPFRATDAATKHLSDLARSLGSPSLVAAAYNGGFGRLRSALDRAGTDSSGTGADRFLRLARAGLLPRETSNYVPQLVAAATIGRDPVKFGFTPAPAIAPLDPRDWTTAANVGRRTVRMGALIRVGRGDDVSGIAARYGVSVVDLRRINALPSHYRLRAGQALRLPVR